MVLPCLDANTNVNVNAASGSMRMPISANAKANAKANAIEQRGTLTLIHKYGSKTCVIRMPHPAYCVHGILASDLCFVAN